MSNLPRPPPRTMAPPRAPLHRRSPRNRRRPPPPGGPPLRPGPPPAPPPPCLPRPKPLLVPTFPHPLVQFVGAHAEHADARAVAGNRYRLCGDVRRDARHRHSGRHDLVCCAAVAGVGASQSLHHRQALKSAAAPAVAGRCGERPPVGVRDSNVNSRSARVFGSPRTISRVLGRERRHFDAQLIFSLSAATGRV